ncbi:methylmalonyl-CoA mutase family protein [Chelativorans sp. M5D2P16]|uniref:methylmalonyl-CoA mutase family protein n=1 Tax=Chelativorans sp. M5D2P16 TaxID=3095678 RepID=UPI002ACADA09|nr:methylmalonyl-CoA mutase family protein [Chelativorans sp. M5D2P16]MDZ5698391.1 methylmalonyl-CoA mutase family protein [Chelativorans sp. M5D2P16]
MDRTVLTKSDFPGVDRKQWLELVAKSLGKDVDYNALVHRTGDGIGIEPLRERAAGRNPLPRRDPNTPWLLVQRLDDPDPVRANTQAKDDLAQGATGLSLVFAGAPNAFGYGLPASAEGLQTVLADIPLHDLHLRIDVHPQSRASVDWLVDILREKRVDPERLSLSFGIDPASLFAGTGRMRMSIEALEASMPQSLAGFFAMALPGILLEADGRVFHNAGATEAQELGIMLASAVAHLRMFEEARQPLIYAAPHIGFSLSIDQDEFLSMAKIRALRKLWARMLEACGIDPMPVAIHAETSYRMMTARDPETNILRTTIAAFAAATGGADSLSVLPHTITHGLPDAFARRLARNTQLILEKECRLDFVADPAAGSGSVEALTESLCEKAWEEFRHIEAEGGVLRSLAAGHLQKRIAAARSERLAGFRDGENKVVGTTVYTMDRERPVTTLSAERQPMPHDGAMACDPLPASRIDEGLGESA